MIFLLNMWTKSFGQSFVDYLDIWTQRIFSIKKKSSTVFKLTLTSYNRGVPKFVLILTISIPRRNNRVTTTIIISTPAHHNIIITSCLVKSIVRVCA